VLESQNSSIPFSEDGISEIDPPESSSLFIPADLQYTDETRTCVIFEEDKEQAFNAWWYRTSWATNIKHKTPQGRSIMCWTTKGRTASCWKGFNQVAVASTGHPKLQCVACNSLLEHPSPKNSGINSMTRHLARSTCKAKARQIESGENVRLCFSKQEVRIYYRYNDRDTN
jgi:hypothetical protein